MSRLRKLQQREFVPGTAASAGQPERDWCPPPPPGFRHVFANGQYQLVSTYVIPFGQPGSTCPAPTQFAWVCQPRLRDSDTVSCGWTVVNRVPGC